jgi:hypothetical protein
LSGCTEEIRLSEVRYIDYDEEEMPDGNTIFPLIHKQKAYSYEEEIRLLYEVKEQKGWQYDWSKEEIQEGKYLTVDIEALIEEVVVGPFSPHWYFEMIKNLMSKYEIDKPIRKSKLSPH